MNLMIIVVIILICIMPKKTLNHIHTKKKHYVYTDSKRDNLVA